MKKIPDIINRLWNVCSQMEVGAFLTSGFGISAIISTYFPYYLFIYSRKYVQVY